jgi:hypothetical protein
VQQGQVASLPNTEEMTADAVKAEEVLAELEASAELAGSVGSIGASGMTEEEQALYEELERESGGAAPAAATKPVAQPPRPASAPKVADASREPAKEPASSAPRRSDPEPG